MNPLESIADAIQAYEGWHVGSRSYRNRNPGNLRPSNVNQIHDSGNYRIFPSLVDGYTALLNDLAAKFHGAHLLTPQSTLFDLVNVYAPSGDSNNPRKYSAFIARWLTLTFRIPVSPETSLGEIRALDSGSGAPQGTTL